MAYELEVPSSFSSVHPIFHVSILRRCIVDLSLIISLERLGISDSLSYEKVPVKILD